MTIRRALSVTAVAEAVAFAANLITVIIISRLLTPEEIGIFSVAVAVIGLAHIFRDFGVTQYVVQADSISNNDLRATFTVALGISWSIALALLLVSQPFGQFYASNEVGEVLMLLAAVFLVAPFGAPIQSLLLRERAFETLAIIGIACTLVSATVTLVAVVLGESYRSMAWGAIAQHLTRAVLANYYRPGHLFLIPSLAGASKILRFGGLSTVATLTNQAGDSGPDLIVGRTLGFSEVAFLSRALGVRRMSVDNLLRIVARVHFPHFAQRVRDGEHPANLFCSAAHYTLAIHVPLLAMLALLAEPLIIFMFGEQWNRSALIATIICIGSILVAPYVLYGNSLTASGHLVQYVISQLIIQATKLMTFALSLWLTLEQVIIALVFAYLFEAIISHYTLRHTYGPGIQRLFAEVFPTIALTVSTLAGPVLVGTAISFSVASEISLFIELILMSALGVAGWIVGIFVIRHELRHDIKNLARRLVHF